MIEKLKKCFRDLLFAAVFLLGPSLIASRVVLYSTNEINAIIYLSEIGTILFAVLYLVLTIVDVILISKKNKNK